MVKVNPHVILRAEIITPVTVPASIASTFGPLCNQVLPRMGIQIAIEFFLTGWLIFFGSKSDFRVFFGRPMFSRSRKGDDRWSDKRDRPLIWDYKFERVPPGIPEEVFGKLLEKFYDMPGSLGEGVIEEIPVKTLGKRYRVTRSSLTAYVSAAEEVVKQAKALYLAIHKNPEVVFSRYEA